MNRKKVFVFSPSSVLLFYPFLNLNHVTIFYDTTKLIFDLSNADTIFLQTPVKTQTTFLI